MSPSIFLSLVNSENIKKKNEEELGLERLKEVLSSRLLETKNQNIQTPPWHQPFQGHRCASNAK